MSGEPTTAANSKRHPVYASVDALERNWANSPEQSWSRTRLVVRSLVEAGLISGGEMVDGVYRVRDSGGGADNKAA